MKKIGILHGTETTFSDAFMERVNKNAAGEIIAEAIRIDKVIQEEVPPYAVILDSISQHVPFYRAYLKNAALSGTAVINNPFWPGGEDQFFHSNLASRIGVPVPKTVLLPSRDLPEGTSGASFGNLVYPLNWDYIFDYIGFPAYLKPVSAGAGKPIYKVHGPEEFFAKQAGTAREVMMLQEEIVFDAYFRCYSVGAADIRIISDDPLRTDPLRHGSGEAPGPSMESQLYEYTRRLNLHLGCDFNKVEFAVRGGVPYAIDFCNPVFDAAPGSMKESNFRWMVETAADYAIHRAETFREGADNLTWGLYLARAEEHQRFGRWITPPDRPDISRRITGREVPETL